MIPGSEGVLFTVEAGDEGASVAAVTIDTGQVPTLVPGAQHGRYSPSGHLVHSVGGDLWAQGFDAARLETSGVAVRWSRTC